jgi:TetR/AcrR family transcriptional regulator, ethionamide resistance regulator
VSAQPAGSRRRAPTAKREAVEADLLQAVNELLDEGASYTDLDVGRIAHRAGISRTAFYFYFADKRELLKRLTEDVVALLYEQADRWWSGSGDGRADLDTALRNAAGLWRANAPVLSAIVEVSGYDAEIREFWRAVIERFIEATTVRLQHEWGPGPHSPSAAATAHVLCWMTERIYYQALYEPGDRHWASVLDSLVSVWHRSAYGPR